MSQRNILVTGGAGFIGSNTVSMLCDLGHKVKIIDDLSFGFQEFVDTRAEFHRGSISDDVLLDRILKGIDVVIHFAGSSIIKFSVENPLSFIENNVYGGTKLLEGMRRNGVKKIIFSSSASVYGEPLEIPIKETHVKNPLHAYGASKLAFESILNSYYHSYGVESTSLRFFNVYGPNDEQQPATRAVPIWTKNILNGKPVQLYWEGNQLRDYIFVRDVAQAHVEVMDLKGCNAFNIGSGTGIMMKDLLGTISSLINLPYEIDNLGKRQGDPDRLVADTNAIFKATGWKPRVKLEEGLFETIKFYKNRLNRKK